MKFITSEQFLKADQKVRQSILEWWKPSVGDLVYDKDNIIDVVVPKLCIGDYKDNLDKSKVIPLLTEGQLREIIEDKVNKRVDIIHYLNSGYNICIDDKTEFYSLGNELLQALWQVACDIV